MFIPIYFYLKSHVESVIDILDVLNIPQVWAALYGQESVESRHHAHMWVFHKLLHKVENI